MSKTQLFRDRRKARAAPLAIVQRSAVRGARVGVSSDWAGECLAIVAPEAGRTEQTAVARDETVARGAAHAVAHKPARARIGQIVVDCDRQVDEVKFGKAREITDLEALITQAICDLLASVEIVEECAGRRWQRVHCASGQPVVDIAAIAPARALVAHDARSVSKHREPARDINATAPGRLIRACPAARRQVARDDRAVEACIRSNVQIDAAADAGRVVFDRGSIKQCGASSL
eukprot:1594274-Prymnesium_polylepis.4